MSASTSAVSMDAAAEAARYALLRRLAPSMRHHLVVHLQPIGMVYEIMERRLRSPDPNLAEVHEGAHKINSYARAALASCLDVITWLAPEDPARVAPGVALAECFSLVQTSFNFRGYSIDGDIASIAGEVRRAAFRNAVTGALVYLSDNHPAPALISVTAQSGAEALEMTLSLAPRDGDAGFATAPTYRPLTWADVQALAAPESVNAAIDGATVRLSLPWALASA